VYRPADAGTYMYHCHFEDVEHVTMGMTGVVFVRPAPTNGRPVDPFRNIVKWAYDDVTTAFEREYTFMLTEIDSRAHFGDAHILETDWTDFRPNFWLMNGRAYPDTLEPGAPFDFTPGPNNNPNLNFGKPLRESDGTTQPPQFTRQPNGTYVAGAIPRLKSQPISSLVVCRPGEKVLLRIANLGFGQQTMTMPGVALTTVGKDARLIPASRRPVSDTVDLGPGESRDILFTAPAAEGTYPFFNRDVHRYPGVDGDSWSGGQRTHVVVKAMPNDAPHTQRFTNHWEPSWLA
jgi:FtsP/CotA-like multicopper oxidase with cupredoxin domain